MKIDEKAVEAVEMQLTPATEIEPTCSSSFNDSSFQSMSLHDEFVLNGYQDDSGMSGGNSIQGLFESFLKNLFMCFQLFAKKRLF